MSIPLSLWAPPMVARPGDQRWVLYLIIGCYPVAYLGLIASPHRLALLWAAILGVALATFPIILVLIGLRTRTPGGTAALSGFTQSLGYLMAAVGPFGVGILHDAIGRLDGPAAGAHRAQPAAVRRRRGTSASRPRIEDQLRAPAST